MLVSFMMVERQSYDRRVSLGLSASDSDVEHDERTTLPSGGWRMGALSFSMTVLLLVNALSALRQKHNRNGHILRYIIKFS